MSWSLNVDPLLKPLLSSSYKKILKKNHKNAPIFLNQAVTNDLSVFANKILVSRPLHLLDPGVVEWNNNEADAVIYTDACLVSSDGSSGIGFSLTINGVPHGYLLRLYLPSLLDIRLAEMLVILAAIQWVTRQERKPRGLLIRSDSALNESTPSTLAQPPAYREEFSSLPSIS